ncbi:MAG: TOPRIM nucleotidyl transferase/hydrolase domain-containing protein [Bacilli bacterium]
MINRYLNNKKCSDALFLIGTNGSGKTYTLKEYQDISEGKSIYISEEGTLDVKMFRSNAIPKLDTYEYLLYPKSKYYGETNEREEIKIVKIDKNLIELLSYCKKEIDFYNSVKNKSKGQEKVSNIFNIIFNTFMNPIKIIFFDEPENFLDDLGLRKISILFSLLKKSNIKLVVATHSYSLCNLLKVPIDNVVFINKWFDIEESSYKNNMICYSLNNIKKMYQMCTEEFEKYIKDKNLDIDKGIKTKMHYYEDNKLFELYLNDVLKSEQFYRALFYKRIILVEGAAENRIIRKLNIEELHDDFFFVTYGKAFMIFFSDLFTKIGKEIIVITDSDKKHKGKSKRYNTAYGITLYLKEKYEKKVKLFDIDLENHFHINKKEYEDKCLLPNEAKVYSADQYFSYKKNIKKFIDFLNKE